MTTFSDALAGIGRYVLLMGRVLTRPDRWRMFFRQYTQHPKPLDAANGGRIYNSRNHVA